LFELFIAEAVSAGYDFPLCQVRCGAIGAIKLVAPTQLPLLRFRVLDCSDCTWHQKDRYDDYGRNPEHFHPLRRDTPKRPAEEKLIPQNRPTDAEAPLGYDVERTHTERLECRAEFAATTFPYWFVEPAVSVELCVPQKAEHSTVDRIGAEFHVALENAHAGAPGRCTDASGFDLDVRAVILEENRLWTRGRAARAQAWGRRVRRSAASLCVPGKP
jgi:hypothetical protein